MSEEPKRKFKGVFIPVEIWDAVNLSWLEKCLLAEIGVLEDDDRGCWASNAYLAKLFNSSPGSINNMLRRLKRFGHITIAPFDGLERCIRIATPYTVECRGVAPVGVGGLHSQVHAPLREEKDEEKEGVADAGAGSPATLSPTDLRLAVPPNSARPPKGGGRGVLRPAVPASPPSEDALADADHFREKLLPADFSPGVGWRDKWARALDKLAAEGRDLDDVWAVCKWARSDSFWSPHFQVPPQLLKRKDGVLLYDRLRSAMLAGKKTAAAPRL